MALIDIRVVFRQGEGDGGDYLFPAERVCEIEYQVAADDEPKGHIVTAVLVGCGILFMKGLSLDTDGAKVEFYEKKGGKWKPIETLRATEEWRRMVQEFDGGDDE